MKRPPIFKRRFTNRNVARKSRLRRFDRFGATRGLTLVELLVASLLISVVILVGWSGLISAMTTAKITEARSARQIELNRALDFMTNEIRAARAINQAGNAIANGTTVTLTDVATSGGVNLSALGSYGTIGLYLERPIEDAPAICPVGGPNSGSPPPFPTTYDPIVYDIRPSPSGWLQPRMLARYGRAPSFDGTIDACNNPVSSDPILDALSTTPKSMPTCSGLLSGAGGFYSCTNGNQVNLFFQSNINNVETKQISSIAASRVKSIASAQISIVLTVNRNGDNADLSWVYNGNPSDISAYQVIRVVNATTINKPKSTAVQDQDNILAVASGDNICYKVEATFVSGSSSVQSNQVCIVK
jgi:hypothetical protein